MKAATVELPKLKRARGGWVLYGRNDDSICPEHQFCTYSGDEPGLCRICHGQHDTDDHYDLPPGRLAPCLCSRCGELFTSITAFAKHKRPDLVRCYKPEKRGLILANQRGWLLWANPGSRPEDI